MRASDAERERVGKLLESAAAEGRLTPDEAGERLAAASTAKYREELGSLIADLPALDVSDMQERSRGRQRGWWVWSVARLGFVAVMMIGFWGLWGVRLFLWPLGLMAFAFFLAPWRRRWHRRRQWHRWQRAQFLRGGHF
ncbi:MAG TPA: DUF1707 domain-containing protein [Gemmatimonadales bacterium]|nr:DUF1707 domain-containing protein [Gemmatimonadales bacterium]